MLVIILWVATFSLLYFLIMKKLNLLRVPLLEEIIGLDASEMGSRVRVESKVEEGIVKMKTLNFHRTSSFLESPTLRKEAEMSALNAKPTGKTNSVAPIVVPKNDLMENSQQELN